MINDEDILSDNELIEKSKNLLFNNLNKGIEDLSLAISINLFVNV